MGTILFLIDEDSANKELRKSIIDSGHEFRLSTDVLGYGAKDEYVRDHAADLDATLITRNKKHFNRLVARRSARNQGQDAKVASVVYLMCEASRGAENFRMFAPHLAHEHALVAQLPAGRLIAQINHARLTIFR